jgi:hypothetical protein
MKENANGKIESCNLRSNLKSENKQLFHNITYMYCPRRGRHIRAILPRHQHSIKIREIIEIIVSFGVRFRTKEQNLSLSSMNVIKGN